MQNFIKLSDNENNTMYINFENIVAINKERCIVYTGNDYFFIKEEPMEQLVQAIEARCIQNGEQ